MRQLSKSKFTACRQRPGVFLNKQLDGWPQDFAHTCEFFGAAI